MRLFVLLMALAGCAGPLQYDKEPQQGQAIVRTVFVSPEQIKAICGSNVFPNWAAAGCALYLGKQNGLDSYALYVERPESFSDERRLAILGAEMLKTMGATYNAPWSRSLK